LEQGLELGLQDAIGFGLDIRFGVAGLRLLPEIGRIHATGLLRAIMEHLKPAESPESIRSIYA
jgi:hypothetical protein